MSASPITRQEALSTRSAPCTGQETPLPQDIATLPPAEVYAVQTTRPTGLTQVEAEERLRHSGRNVIREIQGKPLLLKLLANFTHLMATLLWCGGVIAFVAGMPQLGIAIWMVNLINGAFSFWQEYKAEKATEALRRLLPRYARVLREGEVRQILVEELVPGDVMFLEEGDHISADARLVQEAALRVDQSTLSGEAHPVRKTAEAVWQTDLAHVELPNLVFAGTHVVMGTAKAVVIATGMATAFGRIAHLTQSLGEERSPLQHEIAHVTKVVSVVAVSVGLLFFALASLLGMMSPAEGFMFALGMIVAFVPEGLLPTVTLALALGVERMARRHALVKRLSAVETLGCTTVICTDKTGTLTQNEMTVCALWLGGQQWTVSGVGYAPQGQFLRTDLRGIHPVTSDLRMLLIAAALCNNARLLPPNDVLSRWTLLGDPTEGALLVTAGKAGIDLKAEAQTLPRLRELPFESYRKRMSTMHRQGTSRVAYVKGAPQELVALCTRLLVDGQEQRLHDAWRQQITAAIDGYARDGLRVLAVAQRQLPNDLILLTPETVEQDLTLLGLMAMMDPPRPEVTAAVDTCHRAGIRIIMITGDYGLTAESVARRIGILKEPLTRIVTGAELGTMADEALKDALQHEVIFARMAPEHKLRVVSALKDMGHVVAVTGDGVNDAPALKKADIGVAMGATGSDVAKEAAEMILTDDNFASIVNAVEEGRTVYTNIKKFTSYIFTSNTPEAVPFILFALSGGRIPLALNVMQILAVDLGTDMLPALALGAEPAEPGLMDRPPRSRNEHVITWSLLRRAYLWLGPLQSVAAMAAFYVMYWTQGSYHGQWLDLPASGSLYQAATAMTLAAIVTTQIGNVLAHRTEHTSAFRIGPFTNRLAWVGIATELGLVFAITHTPWLQSVFGTAAFPWCNWLFLLALAPTLLLVDEGRKALRRWQERRLKCETSERISSGGEA
jgi:potassium/sodium efflux P-type ATPase